MARNQAPGIPKPTAEAQLRTRSGLATADTFLTTDSSITSAESFVEARAGASHSPDTFLVAADGFVAPDDRMSVTPADSFNVASEASASTADSFVASVASSFSHGSPYSSLASPCSSQQGFFDSR